MFTLLGRIAVSAAQLPSLVMSMVQFSLHVDYLTNLPAFVFTASIQLYWVQAWFRHGTALSCYPNVRANLKFASCRRLSRLFKHDFAFCNDAS